MQEITSDMGVIVTGPDSIKPVFYVDDWSYGFVHSEGEELVGEEINKHPLIKKKIRWVEGTIS